MRAGRMVLLAVRGLVLAGLGAVPAAALAQGTQADYERAASLAQRFTGKVFRDRIRPEWTADGTWLWYRVQTAPRAHEYVGVEIATGRREPLIDAARLASAFKARDLGAVSPEALPLDALQVEDGRQAIRFRRNGTWWRCPLADYELTPSQPLKPEAARPLLKKDGPRASTRTGEETWLTFINRTAGPVRLIWLDADGNPREYAKIPAQGEHRQHTFAGHVWQVRDERNESLGQVAADDAESQVEITAQPSEAEKPAEPSPPPQSRVFLKDHNIWMAERPGARARALTEDGRRSDSYDGPLLVSPDEKWLLALRTVPGARHPVTVVESSPRDQVQPRVHTFDYTKPGDAINASRPVLFDLEQRRQIEIDAAPFANPWSLTDFRWRADSLAVRFVFNPRGHQALRVFEISVTGQTRILVDEISATFVDYAHKQFLSWLDATAELIWMSERDGWCHLYLYDAVAGQVKSQITRGEWVVRGVDRVDEERRQIWFRAGGIRPGHDPYYVHHCRINFDGSGLVILTEGDGTHEIQLSPDGQTLVDRWSRVDSPPVHELRSAADGRLICELEQADIRLLTDAGWTPPQRFSALGRDGQTDIHGIIVRPTRFDPETRYPVIEKIYAGPHGAHVPKAFQPLIDLQPLAELGFIVVQIDGMGTSHRSKAFHDVCWKNLGDAGFPDRMAWLRAAAGRHPELDLTRVGIFGGSAGGQNALRALLVHGDFYDAAAADCGCHDNRMDKIWWNELWMGWPIGPHYAEQSNVTQAHRLTGKLLLTVGELDRNVDPASTMQVVDALIRADKDFDLLVIPGGGHGSGESPYGARRRADFFVRSLWGVEPRRP